MLSKVLFLTAVPVVMAIAAGIGLPFQAASNVAAGRALGHPLWGAMTSLLVSGIALITIAAILRIPLPTIGNAISGPWWIWSGGLLGAIYVASATVVTPKLGASGFLVCVVAGQMLAAVLADHFGVMGLTSKPVTIAKLAGVLLIFIGVFLVQGTGSAGEKQVDTSVEQQ